MDKLAMETKDITNENIEKILELFPNVATEGVNDKGEIIRAIDFEKLKQELSHNVIDGEESYDFTWVGKKEAMLEANRPIRKTLRPDKESSLHWDTTENIYIEGDNLDALKLLQESYLGRVKMIYIDPPYNTGNDFLYNDSYVIEVGEYDEYIETKDDFGNKLIKNTENKGRFHSDWCSMIYPRLRLAKNLLSDNGVVFISIDDNEIDNMLKICNEIFGYDYVDKMIWRKSGVGRDGKMKHTTTFRKDHEYIVVCFKNNQILNKSFEKPNWENEYGNPDNDYRGGYKAGSISRKEEASNPNHKNYYTVVSPSGKTFTRQFDIPKEQFLALDNDNRIYWGVNSDAVPAIKIFQNEKREVTTSSYIVEKDDYLKICAIDSNNCTTTKGSKEIEVILGVEGLGAEIRPKPLELLSKLIQIGSNENSIILDFFSGSATTAHAVMQLNAEDGGNRKFIMVQLPEKTDEKSEAYKAGYKNICEIGEKRIRKAGEKIQKENPDKKLDVGFRVFKVDDTNMKDVYYSPNEFQQDQLDLFESNIKENRSDEDLLYEVLLNSGVELSLPHKIEIIDGLRVHFIQSNYSSTPDLIACFEDKVPETLVRTIAQYKPTKVVFRDSCFRGDSNKINIEEIFKLITPDTRVKVL